MNQDTPVYACVRTPKREEPSATRAGRLISLALRTGILFVLWAILSGFFDAYHLTLGVLSSLFVAWLSQDFWPPEGHLFRKPAMVAKLAAYIVWLLWEIVKANWHVMKLALHPRHLEAIDPQIMRFKSAMTSKLGLTILANSITLTPSYNFV